MEQTLFQSPTPRYPCFNPHSRETPSGTGMALLLALVFGVSILTRGKPRVELVLCQVSIPVALVSILTRGKPRVERAAFIGFSCIGGSFNPHSRETPSGTCRIYYGPGFVRVSILTRGKPRVELASCAPNNLFPCPVSILTRGKPRVERAP